MDYQFTFEELLMVAPPRRLMEAFRDVPDPRSSQGKRHSLAAVLTVTFYAMLCGVRSVRGISRWCRVHHAEMAGAIGVRRLRCPNDGTLSVLYRRLDHEKVELALRRWLEDCGLVGDGEVSPAEAGDGGESAGRLPCEALVSAAAVRARAALRQQADAGPPPGARVA